MGESWGNGRMRESLIGNGSPTATGGGLAGGDEGLSFWK